MQESELQKLITDLGGSLSQAELPAGMHASVPDLFKAYLKSKLETPPEISTMTCDGQEYKITCCLGAGDGGIAYLAESSHERVIIKICHTPGNALLEAEAFQEEDSRIETMQVVAIDEEKNILILNARVGIPFSYTQDDDCIILSKEEKKDFYQLFHNFRVTHEDSRPQLTNIAIDPRTGECFVFDWF